MTTPSDDEILAAARDAGIILYRDVLGTERWRCDCIRTKLFALYRAAYAAGMEAAAVMCQQIANGHTQAAMNARRVSEVDIEEDRGIGASECVVAIRVANGREST